MMDLVQVTAPYSNAVLLAILPYVSEFARQLELPLPTPLRLEQVQEFRCSPVKQLVGGAVVLTNGYLVWFENGYVSGFRTPGSYYNLQDPRDIPAFYGPVMLSPEEALQLARRSILKLGYTLEETFTDQRPDVDMPPQKGTNIVPHYRFKWKDPVFGSMAVLIEVDAQHKGVQELKLSSPFFWRRPPNVALAAKVVKPRRSVSATVSNDMVRALLPNLSRFAERLQLPVRTPVSVEQVASVAFLDADWDVRLKLTNGYWFIAQKQAVTEFSAPHSVYGRPPPALEPFPRPFREYLGKWKLAEKEAIAVVHAAVKRLGYSVKEFNAEGAPDVLKPELVGGYVVPRYWFHWLTNDPQTRGTLAMLMAEVDGETGEIKHLRMLCERLAREAYGTNMPVPRVLDASTNTGGWLRMEIKSNAPLFLPAQPKPTLPPNPYE